jgi:hypothetical protein
MDVDISTDTIIDKVFAGFKKITPALVAVSLVSGAILFLPKAILELLGLNELPDNVRTTIGVTFLLSAALIITIVVSSCWKSITRKIKHKNMLKNLRSRFIALAPEQKEIVLELLKSEDKVILLDIAAGNTRYLQENNFIHRPEQIFSAGYDNEVYMKFIPHPWLIDLYNKEPELFA